MRLVFETRGKTCLGSLLSYDQFSSTTVKTTRLHNRILGQPVEKNLNAVGR